MSVRIRLRRMGKKKTPFYRLAVVDSRTKRDGRFVEFVGHYDPMTEPPKVKLDEEKIFGWMKNGASCSDTVTRILRQAGLMAKWHELQTGQKVEPVVRPAAKPAPAKTAKGKAAKAEAAPVGEKSHVEAEAPVEAKVEAPEVAEVKAEAPEVAEAAEEQKAEKPAAKAKAAPKAKKAEGSEPAEEGQA